jgi:outer membrane protein
VKNLSLILNGVLLVAVAILYVLHFNAKSQSPAALEAQDLEGISLANVGIAYVNADSLLANYEFVKTKQSEMENKSKRFDSEYKSRVEGLQREIESFQRTAQSMTMNQARATEENLLMKQQNLQRYEQTLAQELMADQNKINQELYEEITKFLNEYGKKNNIQLVLKYNPGSDVLYASDSLDITKTVTQMLNKRYTEKSTQKSEEKE